MSGYFQRIAMLAQPSTPRHNSGSPFGPPKPPVSHFAQTATNALPTEVVATPAAAASADGAPPLLQQGVTGKTNVESAAAAPLSRRASNLAPTELMHAQTERERARSIGETIASDLSTMGWSSSDNENARADALPLPIDVRYVQSTTTTRATQRPKATPSISDIDSQADPARVLIQQGSAPTAGELGPDARVRQAPAAAQQDEPAAATALTGPRTAADVAVTIGAVNLSTEPPLEAPPSAAQPRPARASGPTSGIWSGGRAFARSYVRRG